MLIRLLLAYYFRENYYRYPLEIIWNRNVIFYPNDINFAGYGDFQSYYFSWTQAWFEQDWYPFNDWQETVTHRDDPLYMYSYPPLFLYFLLNNLETRYDQSMDCYPNDSYRCCLRRHGFLDSQRNN